MISLVDILIHTFIAGCIAVPMGTFHEYLHRRKATQLGLKVEKWSWRRNETIVDVDDKEMIDKISMAPYKVIVPLSLLIFCLGIYFIHLGLMVGAGAVLLMHIVTFTKEGVKEE